MHAAQQNKRSFLVIESPMGFRDIWIGENADFLRDMTGARKVFAKIFKVPLIVTQKVILARLFATFNLGHLNTCFPISN
jgi:hypothetical protein